MHPKLFFCECKTDEQLIKIFKTCIESGQNVLGTRASIMQYQALKVIFKDIQYNETAKILTFLQNDI